MGVQSKFYQANEVDFSLSDLEAIRKPFQVLMCTPTYFDITDDRNRQMVDYVDDVNKMKAFDQWRGIKDIYIGRQRAFELKKYHEINGAPGCEDMVFVSNAGLPWLDKSGDKIYIHANMKFSIREREKAYFQKFFFNQGYDVIELDKQYNFEAKADCLAIPTKRCFFGGYGCNTEKGALKELAQVIETPIIGIELQDPLLNHLDLCFRPIDERTAFVVEHAIDKASLQLIEKLFATVYKVSKEEAYNYAVNVHTLTGIGNEKLAILQENNPEVAKILKNLGYLVFEQDTTEFIKSGGSVNAMKMMFF